MTNRDPVKVIDAILEHIPPEENFNLRARLKKIQEDAGFRPPECQWLVWKGIQTVLEDFLHSPPQDDWEKRISDIVEGRAEK
jgi:hypothetical protein